MKRNPRVFNGKYISVTRQDDGTYHPNFKPLKTGRDFTLERYTLGVLGTHISGAEFQYPDRS